MNLTETRMQQELSATDGTPPSVGTVEKQPFVAPKLTFVTPTVTKRGDFSDLTEGFFGVFTPPSS